MMIDLFTPSPLDRRFTVFLNCPQGPDFRDHRHAMALAAVASGHKPICDFVHARIHIPRLAEHIVMSKYSIHECAACLAGGHHGEERFNVPIELGMAWLQRQNTDKNDLFHESLILVPKGNSLTAALMTLNNGNCLEYERPLDILDGVVEELSRRSGRPSRPTFTQLVDAWDSFRERRPAPQLVEGRVVDLGQADLLGLMIEILSSRSWWETPPWMRYDVFLAYHTEDKDDVEKIFEKLSRCGLKPWFDAMIPPGRPVTEGIEQAISRSKAAAVMFGLKGLGRWQRHEIHALIARGVEENVPVIPVLLPGVSELPKVSQFLRTLRWVIFKALDDEKALHELCWGITGEQVDWSHTGRWLS